MNPKIVVTVILIALFAFGIWYGLKEAKKVRESQDTAGIPYAPGTKMDTTMEAQDWQAFASAYNDKQGTWTERATAVYSENVSQDNSISQLFKTMGNDRYATARLAETLGYISYTPGA